MSSLIFIPVPFVYWPSSLMGLAFPNSVKPLLKIRAVVVKAHGPYAVVIRAIGHHGRPEFAVATGFWRDVWHLSSADLGC